MIRLPLIQCRVGEEDKAGVTGLRRYDDAIIAGGWHKHWCAGDNGSIQIASVRQWDSYGGLDVGLACRGIVSYDVAWDTGVDFRR